jgi:hypothetical protein
MEECKISLCIPTMNRYDTFLQNYLKKYVEYLEKKIIDEIVICDENGEDYDKILNCYGEFMQNNTNFRIYKNDAVLGSFKNKNKVCSLSKNKYIALIDSDNFCDDKYFITAKKYILQNENNFSNHFILSPSFAKPNFNFKHFENLIITKENVKNYFCSYPEFATLLNLGNYITTNKICEEIIYDNSVVNKLSAIDVSYLNLLSFQQFNDYQIYIVKDFEYEHVVHDGSTYTNTIHEGSSFYDSFIVPGYHNIL